MQGVLLSVQRRQSGGLFQHIFREGRVMPDCTIARVPRESKAAMAGRRVIWLTLTAAMTLGMLASTIYVPSIPAIAYTLDTSVAWVQFTFVGYLVAFAAGMLVLGPLSDRFGRRRVMICGLALSVLSSATCAASPTIECLIAARILQGAGACAGMVVGRATIRDLYGREGAAQMIAGLAIVMTLVQSFAPIPGGYLDAWIGWRANFAVITAFALAGLALTIRYLPETRDPRVILTGASAMLPGMVLLSYWTLLRTRRFMGYALTAAGAHAGFHVFAAGAPAVLISSFGISSEEYGYYASLPPIGFLLGSFISNRMTLRLGADLLIGCGSGVLIPACSVMVALTCLHIASPYIIVVPMILICCGSGLMTPNAVASSLGVSPPIVGTASGLTSSMQMATAAAATAALSLGASGSSFTLAIVIAATGLFGVTAFSALAPLGPLTAERGAEAGF
jgi:DHA1 family bicyclomycin/chloramphenicol resistance-like MFS transporter